MTDIPKRKVGRPRKLYIPSINLPQESEYTKSHPDWLLELMSKGLLNCQIQAQFNLSRDTFNMWRKEHEDFAKAYEIGRPKRFAVWLAKGITAIEEKNDRGVKYWTVIMNNCFSEEGWTSEYNGRGTTVNINNSMQTANIQLSPQELLENIKTKFNSLYDHEQKTILEFKPELTKYVEIKKKDNGSEETRRTE